MIELGHRIHKHENLEMERYSQQSKAGQEDAAGVGTQKQEHLVALYLNTQNQIIPSTDHFYWFCHS